MGFPIPEPYCWDKSFEVFYKTLDDEHKGLFDGIFAVAKSPGDAGTLSSLVTKVKAHFATEEGMMKTNNYPDFGPHKKMHDDFVTKCGTYSVPVDAKQIDYLKDWLVNHIKGTDFKYKGKLG